MLGAPVARYCACRRPCSLAAARMATSKCKPFGSSCLGSCGASGPSELQQGAGCSALNGEYAFCFYSRSFVWEHGGERIKKAAAERREQRHRAEARGLQRFMKTLEIVARHRGSQMTAIGAAFSEALHRRSSNSSSSSLFRFNPDASEFIPSTSRATENEQSMWLNTEQNTEQNSHETSTQAPAASLHIVSAGDGGQYADFVETMRLVAPNARVTLDGRGSMVSTPQAAARQQQRVAEPCRQVCLQHTLQGPQPDVHWVPGQIWVSPSTSQLDMLSSDLLLIRAELQQLQLNISHVTTEVHHGFLSSRQAPPPNQTLLQSISLPASELPQERSRSVTVVGSQQFDTEDVPRVLAHPTRSC